MIDYACSYFLGSKKIMGIKIGLATNIKVILIPGIPHLTRMATAQKQSTHSSASFTRESEKPFTQINTRSSGLQQCRM